MNSRNNNRILTAAVTCGVAAFLGFLLQESGARTGDLHKGAEEAVDVIGNAATYFGLIGLLIGAGLALSNEYGALSVNRVAVRMIAGALAGGICGMFGGIFGQLAFSSILETDSGLMLIIFARTFGWAVVGAGIGLSGGMITQSRQKVLKGLVGGALGGGVGGLLFDMVSVVGSGTASRMIGGTLIGILIGIFVVAIEEMTKTAWVTVVLGRNEGKQYIIDKPNTTIGRNELSDIPLFGDMSVSKNHAAIRWTGEGKYAFLDNNSTSGSLVNGARVSSRECADGDTIQIGKFTLVFSLRARGNVPMKPAPHTPPPVFRDTRVCPYCGGLRDPHTGQCACSNIGAAPSAQSNRASLVAVSGPYASVAFTIEGPISIGRDHSNTIVLDRDGGVSRNHASISMENGVYFIRDNNSSNGTYVNGMRVESAYLNNGDVIHIGSGDYAFRLG